MATAPEKPIKAASHSGTLKNVTIWAAVSIRIPNTWTMPYFQDTCGRLRFPIAEGAEGGLRPAQLAAAHALSAHFFARHDPAIVVMPTGTGKTCVMQLAAFLLRARRVLVLTPSRMVREQIAHGFSKLRLLKALGVVPTDAPSPIVVEVSSKLRTVEAWQALEEADVVVTTLMSASPALAEVASPPHDLFDLILCDEAHHTPAPSWQALLDHFAEARHALFTATPFRRDANALRGRIVFHYELARAREEGVYGQLHFEPVDPEPDQDPDAALARAAAQRLKLDRAAGFEHLLMVRTAQKARAKDLQAVYENETNLRLVRVLGTHSQRHVRAIIEKLRRGDLDGVICVDMLGEGFDLPSLKVAVLHSPHRSLAVTLQFIGRFARTTAPKVGPAHFLAVPSEIEIEAEKLYMPGAEWNEIVERASAERITAEREAREVLDTFEAVASDTAASAGREGIPVGALTPYFHVKIIQIKAGVDLDRPLALPAGGEPILYERSDEHHAVVVVTRHVTPYKWSRDDRLTKVTHDLYILYFDEPSSHLFICSSRRDNSAYDALVESVAKGAYNRLSPAELNRVLRDLRNASFFSVGMRNRSAFGSGESYRIVTGRSADHTIQKADGKFYDRGHCFGRGETDGKQVTIGFSSASKVWANQYGNVARLFGWCRMLAKRLADDQAVNTQSGLEHLPLGERATEFPDHISAVDWHDIVYRRDSLRLHAVADGTGWPLLDFSLTVETVSSEELTFHINGHGHAIQLRYRLDRPQWFAQQSDGEFVVGGDGDARQDTALVEFLQENPPSFFTADLSRLEGCFITHLPTDLDESFDANSIECIDWAAAKVNPLLEKPNDDHDGSSLFEWLETRLLDGGAEVVFNDDGSGELADFITLENESDSGQTNVALYHCKAAGRRPVPGRRVSDLYDVTGQAVKSVRLATSGSLRKHLLRRARTTMQGAARLVRGSVDDIRRHLGDSQPCHVVIYIVQPGVGEAPPRDMSHLLAAADGYVRGAQAGGLRVIGSVAAKNSATAD